MMAKGPVQWSDKRIKSATDLCKFVVIDSFKCAPSWQMTSDWPSFCVARPVMNIKHVK